MSYLIKRYYSDERPAKDIKAVATLAEAKAHCSSRASRGFIKTRGPLRQGGVHWFDGFVEIKSKTEPGPRNLRAAFKL